MIYFTSPKGIMRNCVRVARQTLTLFVWVQILVPQPYGSTADAVLFLFKGILKTSEMNLGVPVSLITSFKSDSPNAMFTSAELFDTMRSKRTAAAFFENLKIERMIQNAQFRTKT